MTAMDKLCVVARIGFVFIVVTVKPTSSLVVGPYKVLIEGVEECQSESLTQTHVQLTKISDDEQRLRASVTVPEDFPALQGRVKVFKKSLGAWTPAIAAIVIADICKVEAFMEILASSNITVTEECGLKKGNYEVSDFSLNGPIHDLIGSETQHGLLKNQLVITSQTRQAMCVVVYTNYVAL